MRIFKTSRWDLLALTVVCLGVVSARNSECDKPELKKAGCTCDTENKFIDCRDKKLSSVPDDIPESATSLYLNKNQIDKIDQIGDLSNLIYLNMDGNNVEKIQFDVFDNMDSLTRLVLSNNKLTNLDDDTFEWNPLRLEVINLNGNQFKYIQHFLFYDLERLQEIHLAKNQIAFVHPHAFQQLKELRKLDLSGNHLKTFNPQWLEKLGGNAMELADFSGNQWACDCGMKDAIEWFGKSESYWFTDLIDQDSAKELKCSTPTDPKSYKGSVLREQKNSELPCKAPRITGISKPSTIEEGRSVLLRCQATGAPEPVISWIAPNEDVYRLNSDNFKGVNVDEAGNLLIKGLKKSDSGKYICQASSNTGSGTTKNNVVQVSTTVSVSANDGKKNPDEPHSGPIKEVTGDEGVKVHTSDHCPSGCTCLADQIDCSYPQQDKNGNFRAKMEEFPVIRKGILKSVTSLYNLEGNAITEVPNNVCKPFSSLTELRLNDNNIASFGVNAFDDCKSLKVLTLRKNEVTTIPANVFTGMPMLNILVLDENELSELGQNSFTNMEKLRWIYLRGNNIKIINDRAFNKLPSLDFIHLEENHMRTIETGWIEHLKGQVDAEGGKIFLNENPVVCDCKLKPFFKRKEHFKDMVDFEEIVCDGPHRDVALANLKIDQLECNAHTNEIRANDLGGSKTTDESEGGGLHLILGALLGVVLSVGGVLLYRKYKRGQILGQHIYHDIAYRDISNTEAAYQHDEAASLTQNQQQQAGGAGTEAYI